MMRVLHVIESLGRGGAERVLAVLARALRDDVEFHVVSLVGRGPVEADLRLAGAQVYSLELERRRDVLRALPSLTRLVRRIRPDVLHAHLLFPELYAALLPLPRGTKLAATFHNEGYDASRMMRADYVLRAVEKRLIRRFDRLFAVSEQSANSYRRHLGVRSIDVIFNPVDIDRLRRFASHPSCTAKAAELRARGPLVVQVGAFRPVKGHDVVLEALAGCAPGERFVWVCVGDGPERKRIEETAERRGLQPWTYFAGECDYDETAGWLGIADVALLPSLSEGVPMVALEAMALGRPFVGTRTGGVPEVARDRETALLANPGDPAALRDALLETLRDPVATKARAARATALAETHFAAPVIARQWLSAWRDLVEAR